MFFFSKFQEREGCAYDRVNFSLSVKGAFFLVKGTKKLFERV